MYSKRQKLYKDQIRREGTSDGTETSEAPSLERQRSASVSSTTTHIPRDDRPTDRPPVIYRPKPTTRRTEGMVYRPIETGYRSRIVSQRLKEDGYEQAQFEADLRRTIPRKVEWQLMSDDVRAQVRSILNQDYRKALVKRAETSGGVAADTLKSQVDPFIKPIAAQIDRTLRMTLLPDPVDVNLFDTGLTKVVDDFDSKLKADLKVTAELSLKLEEKASSLAESRELLEDLKLKNRLAKEKLANLTESAFTDDPEDYVQMLAKYPSSSDY